MFYIVPLERQVDVEPRMFGPGLENSIKQKVIREVCNQMAVSLKRLSRLQPAVQRL